MENSVSAPMTFPKSLLRFMIVGLVLMTLIYVSFFALVSRQADLFGTKSCDRETSFWEIPPEDKEFYYEPCRDQIWRKNVRWSFAVFILSLFYWLPFMLLGASVWQKAFLRYFQQRRTVGIIFIFLASLLPSMITIALLFYKFSFAQP